MPADPIDGQTVPTEKIAQQVAKVLGCAGAHKVDDQWAPCPSREDLDFLIKNGAPAYREWRDSKKSFLERHVISPEINLDLEVKEKANGRRYRTRTEAEEHASAIGCSGSHLVATGFWMPCASAEALEEIQQSRVRRNRTIRDPHHASGILKRPRPMGLGVSSIPGGGLISGTGI